MAGVGNGCMKICSRYKIARIRLISRSTYTVLLEYDYMYDSKVVRVALLENETGALFLISLFLMVIFPKGQSS